jgi:hypothetical protein
VTDSAFSGTTAVALARLGRGIRWLVGLYLLILTMSIVATTLAWPWLLTYHPALARIAVDPGSLTAIGRIAAFAALAIPALPMLWSGLQALRLCQLMTEQALFTAEAPQRLRRMGLGLIAAAILQPVGSALLSLTVSSLVGDGERHVAIALSPDYVGLAVIGAVLVAVAAAAREAVRLADENSHFV